jgi:hypothetical protein
MAIRTLGPFRLDTQDELLFYREEPVPLRRGKGSSFPTRPRPTRLPCPYG